MRETKSHNIANAERVKRSTRVLLVGERFLLLDALRLALKADTTDVAAVGTNRRAVEEALEAFQPAVVVFDGSHSSIEAIPVSLRPILRHDLTVIAIAAESVSAEAAQMISAGAHDVLGLDTGFLDLAQTIKRAVGGEATMALDRRYALQQLLREYRSAEARRWLRFEELTDRERVIFALVYEGMSADQIADDACVSVSTVRSHIRSILTKLDVHSQLAAVAMARGQNWFATESVTGAA